jgi:hypothetical protein
VKTRDRKAGAEGGRKLCEKFLSRIKILVRGFPGHSRHLLMVTLYLKHPAARRRISGYAVTLLACYSKLRYENRRNWRVSGIWSGL